MVAGFETPTSGEIFVDEKKINDIPPNKRNSTMVFQSYALFPHLNVQENISFGLKLRGVDKKISKDKLAKAIKMVGLAGYEKRRPNELSGGQQQRVALARALVVEPQLLLFDEPLSNLDAKLRESMRTEIRRIQQELGITAIYVTHDQVEAMAISDRVVVMKDGKIEQAGAPWDIYLRPVSRFVSDFMGAANFVTGEIKNIDKERTQITLGSSTVDIPYTAENAKSGSKATLVIRPENIIVSAKDKGLFNANVTARHYLGGTREYRIENKILGNLTARESVGIKDQLFDRGEQVGIDFRQKNLHYIVEA